MNDKIIKDVQKWFEQEIKSSRDEIDARNQKIDKLEKLIKSLKEFSSSEGYEELYEKEKDRLIKLYNHYTKIEANCYDLEKRVEGWEKWFSLNRQAFERLFSTAPPEELFSSEKKKKYKVNES